ncbi:MAG TPA: Wadjet anti-phage system protein JetA family protein [Clostridium sp.]|uniref:Wadjet anti-phage system protein JetA family protein n=1 Tax=Clostridium sp. TaxID=1506 RepID=UPI002F940CC9
MKLFDVLPIKFFSILSSINKEIYSDCLFILYKVVNTNTSFGVDREIVTQTFVDYFESLEQVNIFMEENETMKNSRDSANFIIRKLDECGWIDIETTNNYNQIINLRDYAISMLGTMDKIINNEGLEYQGYVYTIFSILFSNESTEYNVMLEQVYENTHKLVNGLKTLNSNIKKYIDQITLKKTPEEIMKLHFEGYAQNIVDKGYHRLKTSDNVSKFRPRIIERLEAVKSDKEYLKIVCKQELEMEKYKTMDEAYDKVTMGLNDTINALYNIDQIIDEIDRKNFQYIRASLSRVKYLLNNTRDLSGQITEILKYISSSIENDNLNLKEDIILEIEELFGLFPQNFIDGKSLYVSNEGKKDFKPQEIDKANIVSKEQREQKIKQLKEKNKTRMSKENVDKFILNALGNNKTINASSLELNEVKDYIRIIYIIIYGKSRLVHYKIKKLSNKVIVKEYSFNDFEIWRK